MEPRPQRPRHGQQPASPQGGRPANPPSGNSGGASEGYVDDYEEQTYIAPPRTEYDYSPLDLAPPGQRRRRQFVAAAIGALAILMVVAIGVLAYLLFGDDNDDPSVDVAALATENAATRTALDARSTEIANAGAAQTATAGGESESTTEPTTEGNSTEESDADDPTTPAESGDAEPTATAEGTEASGEATEAPGTAGDGAAGPNVAALDALQPVAEDLPEGLDADEDSSLDQASVVVALGSSRTAEQNLERWGWSGNSGHVWTASDPEALAEGETASLTISIHGFKDAPSATEALTYFSDVLAADEGYEEGTPPELGESARVLSTTDENGAVVVALYVQQGNILYRFGGFAAAGGDPTEDVIALATATLPAGE